MSNPICHICGVNRIYKEYKGYELLSENKDKPCIECYWEWKDQEENEDEEDYECEF